MIPRAAALFVAAAAAIGCVGSDPGLDQESPHEPVAVPNEDACADGLCEACVWGS